MSMIYWNKLKEYYKDISYELLWTCLEYAEEEMPNNCYLHTSWIVGRYVSGLRGFPQRVAYLRFR